ncbi:hypothetical protein N9N67_04640 [Bacteriovoracaceae bacterium]|nr:hypothetical protein [Bacteriovoracaceae bacterium]
MKLTITSFVILLTLTSHLFADELSKYKCVKTITTTNHPSDNVNNALDGMESGGSSSTETRYHLIKDWFGYSVIGCNSDLGAYSSLNACVNAFTCTNIGNNELEIKGPGIDNPIIVNSNISDCNSYLLGRLKTNKVKRKYRTAHSNSGGGYYDDEIE